MAAHNRGRLGAACTGGLMSQKAAVTTSWQPLWPPAPNPPQDQRIERAKKVALVGGGILVAGVVGYAIWDAKFRRKPTEPKKPRPAPKPSEGEVVCPDKTGKTPAPGWEQIERGDFVVLHLRSGDGRVTEPVWSRVMSRRKDEEVDRLYVELIAQDIMGDPKPLRLEHGFEAGDHLFVSTNCVWEILKNPSKSPSQILCGANLDVVDMKPLGDPQAPADVPIDLGDLVAVVVAAKPDPTAWHEVLWVFPTNTAGHVIEGEVFSEPQVEAHELKKGSKLMFSRDCIVDKKPIPVQPQPSQEEG